MKYFHSTFTRDKKIRLFIQENFSLEHHGKEIKVYSLFTLDTTKVSLSMSKLFSVLHILNIF